LERRSPSRIDSVFAAARSEGRAVLIPFITAGDPSLDATVDLAETVAGAGAEILEVGVPFSDPIADGPTIQRASERALAGGTTLRGIIGRLPDVARRAGIPIVLMSYLNPVLRYGLGRFARDAKRAGADGVILSDLPVEEAGEALGACGAAGLDLVLLAAPTSGKARLARIADASRGFIYAIARTGVTGAREELPRGARDLVASIRAVTSKPVALGFGISTPSHVRSAAQHADGVVVGSAIVDLVGRFGGEPERMLREVGRFSARLAAALRDPAHTAPPDGGPGSLH
jgi:tryptophan synthase alpha chain